MSLHRFGHDCKVLFITVGSNFFHSSFNARLRPAKVYSLRFCKRRLMIPQIAKSIDAASGLSGIHSSGVTKLIFCWSKYASVCLEVWLGALSWWKTMTVFNLVSRKHSGKIFFDKRLKNFIDIEVWIKFYTFINNTDIRFTNGSLRLPRPWILEQMNRVLQT